MSKIEMKFSRLDKGRSHQKIVDEGARFIKGVIHREMLQYIGLIEEIRLLLALLEFQELKMRSIVHHNIQCLCQH